MSIELQKKWNGAYPEDTRRLEHLRHERRHAAQLAVARANTAQDRVKDGNLGFRAGHEAARLCHERDDADLPDVCAFSAHVRAS